MTAADRPDDDLRWLAARYVLDELDGPAVEGFERRLADDPAACDAVAEAVELLLAVDRAGAAPAAAPVRRRARWAVAGSAVALAAAAVVAVALLPGGAGDSVAVAPPDRPADPASLGRAWSTLRLSEVEPEADAWEADALVAGLDPDALPAADPIEAEGPPDWLIAAVRLSGEPLPPESARRELEN